jgi:hypothetical protein
MGEFSSPCSLVVEKPVGKSALSRLIAANLFDPCSRVRDGDYGANVVVRYLRPTDWLALLACSRRRDSAATNL